jgi:hypothetical protein
MISESYSERSLPYEFEGANTIHRRRARVDQAVNGKDLVDAMGEALVALSLGKVRQPGRAQEAR